MSSYLTTASASSTYQTIANMSNYITTASASTTYQTISGMTGYVNTTIAQNISGIKTFNSLPVCSGIPSSGSQLVKKHLPMPPIKRLLE